MPGYYRTESGCFANNEGSRLAYEDGPLPLSSRSLIVLVLIVLDVSRVMVAVVGLRLVREQRRILVSYWIVIRL